MESGFLEFNNKIYLFKLDGDRVKISFGDSIKLDQELLAGFSILKNMFGGEKKFKYEDEVEKIKKIKKINDTHEGEKIERFNLYGITDNGRLILMEVSYCKFDIINLKVKDFKIHNYILLGEKHHWVEGTCIDSVNVSIKGNDINVILHKLLGFDLYNLYLKMNDSSKYKFIRSEVIAEYEFEDEGNNFNVEVSVFYNIEREDGHLGFKINNGSKKIHIGNINNLIRLIYRGCFNFLRYICRKYCLDINNILDISYSINNRNHRGSFLINSYNYDLLPESVKNYEGYIIELGSIKNTKFINNLFRECTENNLPLEHLPLTIGTRHKYDSLRNIGNFCTFEREFRKNFEDKNVLIEMLKKDYDKNEKDKFLSLSDKIFIVLNENRDILDMFINEEYEKFKYLNNNILEKIRDHINSFIDESNSSINKNQVLDKLYCHIKKCIDDDIKKCIISLICNELENFIKSKKSSFLKLNDDNCIHRRLGKIRNKLVHSLILKVEESSDIPFDYMEKLIYIMTLKRLGLESDKIKGIINVLYK